ncbi:MAG: hypothetical protein HPY66_3596 [Firmicutes bacterium]|nr:hypothetical protein [Bacillota bacterium]MDI6704793.1 hypothetical protein [Bacillota bacterium]
MKKRCMTVVSVMILTLALAGCAANSFSANNPGGHNSDEDIKLYTSGDGWSFEYPKTWDKVEKGFVQETATGKTIVFDVKECTEEELEEWLRAEISRKLNAEEADNELVEPLTNIEKNHLTLYTYTIKSKGDGSEALLKNAVFYDGKRRYELRTTVPPVAEEEFNHAIDTFRVDK